ncbi:hypothetical protein D770_17450 [Flammeovirgaceae bacterium 311]|nr:hypothetical protein D770_17450 [Flammeovirgaceae bacterium 311]
MLNSGNSNKKRAKIEGKPVWVFPFFIAFFLWAATAQAQIHEVGISLGASNYVGDLVQNYSFRNHRPAGSIFYRYNLSNYISLRGNVMVGKLVGSDERPYDAFAERRNRGQFNNWVNELSVLFEYNFFDHKFFDDRQLPWSPYFVGGIGFMLQHGYDDYRPGNPAQAYAEGVKTTDFKNYQPVIPVGVGVEYHINPAWTLGIEWIARKTFFDYLDNTGEVPEIVTNKNFQYGNPDHKDWYFTTGITLSYTFWTIPCPYHFNPKKYL